MSRDLATRTLGWLGDASCARRAFFRHLPLLGLCALLSGCAAVAPLSGLISVPLGGSPPLQMHSETIVRLEEDNFMLVRTNVYGWSKGFSLLGLITMVPATLPKAMDRVYASAAMSPGKPQTVAHLIIQQSSAYWILFSIPRVEVHADIVEFRPEAVPRTRAPPYPGSPGHHRHPQD
jgi:hypothetical protein